jgi:demethylmenaquinone methyltransferase/2-methoxy-6-polyprenyl-1,4-benzoquinol methylase
MVSTLKVIDSMGQDTKTALVYRFFSGTGSTYDLIAHFATLGCDQRWKSRILEQIPEGSTKIMDQACGTGILTLKIARQFPHCRVVGVDLLDEYLTLAKEKARRLKLENVEFILGRAEEVFPGDGFDCITSSYLAKYAELGSLIENIRKMLRSGGTLVIHDFTYPSNPTFAHLWELYFKLLQAVGRWTCPQWKTALEDLPELLRQTGWVTQLTRGLEENAFSEIQAQSLTLGTSTIVTARKK